MDYTVDNFKTYFAVRYFTYFTDLAYVSTKTYNTGDEVYYNGSFWTSTTTLNTGNEPSTTSTYWTLTIDNQENYILDTDITNAIGEATLNFNESLWDSNSMPIAFGYLVAHYLCCDIQTALQGIASNGNYPVLSKSVGSISVGFVIPQMYLTDPFVAYLNKTGFGQKYFSLLLPRLRGKGITIAIGRSLP